MGGNTCLNTGTLQSEDDELYGDNSNVEGGSTDSVEAREENVIDDKDSNAGAKPVEDDTLPLAAAESDRGLSLHKRLWEKIDKVSQDINSLKLGYFHEQ